MGPAKNEPVLLATEEQDSSKAEAFFQDANILIRDLHAVECSMCGDIGLPQELFRCIECQFRLQHTYCSHSYPNKRSYARICNWCDRDGLHDVVSNPKIIKATLVNNETTTPLRSKNELEMLLEGAAMALKKERELERSIHPSKGRCKFKDRCWMTKKPRKMLRGKSNGDETKDANIKVGESGNSKCKGTKSEAQSFRKRMGRRYKCILDVY